MESFKQSHNATTCGLFLQLSDKNLRALLENSRTFFKIFQNFTIFPEKFQNNARNSRMNDHPVLLKTDDEMFTYKFDKPH